MKLFYDERDDSIHEKRGSQILYWLDDLGASPLSEANPEDVGFLFAGARSMEDYRTLIAGHPDLRDTAAEREPLLTLDKVLDRLDQLADPIPAPRTWKLALDCPFPDDLTFPLFVRTALSSWKRGGRISKVHNTRELIDECEELRRAFGWDALILAREWLDLAAAGEGTYGPIPQEVRTWIVDQIPFAWSFHYLNVLPEPSGFPLNREEEEILFSLASRVGSAFESRLVAADFARTIEGEWCFIEAGAGSCAGTAHESVFKSVAARLAGLSLSCEFDPFGGRLQPMDPPSNRRNP